MNGNENNIKNISWNDENERNCSFFSSLLYYRECKSMEIYKRKRVKTLSVVLKKIILYTSFKILAPCKFYYSLKGRNNNTPLYSLKSFVPFQAKRN